MVMDITFYKFLMGKHLSFFHEKFNIINIIYRKSMAHSSNSAEKTNQL